MIATIIAFGAKLCITLETLNKKNPAISADVLDLRTLQTA
jgi:pyruvate/2-oxoglutarate/acetoin dehydrogenase E1 component